tara:strand:+ start:516 stop:1106 length:591 start_codon:yes stop_codon:yes gene_type:complete
MAWVALGAAAIGAGGSYLTGKATASGEKAKADASKYGSDLQSKTALNQLNLDRDKLRLNRDKLLMGADLGRSGQGRAEGSLNRFMGDFNQATTGTPEAVSRLQQLIRDQALPEQQRALAQGNISRQQQGVRGIDSAVLAQQQSNALNKDLAMQAEGMALEQALRDRQARQQQAAKLAQGSLAGSIAGTTNYKPAKI